MKNYIKSFLLFALVCVGLVSCNEQDMTDNVTYPEHGPLQTWKSCTATRLGLDYYISNSVNLAGDTVCNVVARNLETGEMMTFMLDGRSEYDKVSGLALNNFAQSPIDNLPAEIAVGLRNDLTTASVQLAVFVGTNRYTQDSFRAAPQKGFPLDNSFWTSLDEAAPVQAMLLFMPENKFMTLIGETYFGGTYEWDKVKGTGVLHMAAADEEGTPLPDADVKDQGIYMNQYNQFVMKVDGVEYILKLTLN